jgi:hypothetical protein
MNNPRHAEPSIVLDEVGVTGGSVDVSTPSESRWASPSASAEAARRRIGTRGDEDLRTTILLWNLREPDPIRVTHLETATRMPDRWWPNRRAPNDAMRNSITASSRVLARLYGRSFAIASSEANPHVKLRA